MYAFSDAFDAAYILKHDLESILNSKIPMTILTDSKSSFDVITKCTTTSEKHLMIYISFVREAYEKQEISDVAYV